METGPKNPSNDSESTTNQPVYNGMAKPNAPTRASEPRRRDKTSAEQEKTQTITINNQYRSTAKRVSTGMTECICSTGGDEYEEYVDLK